MYENGNKVTYIVVLRSIYGMIVAALFFYNNFCRDLENIWFDFNTYNPCVTNSVKVGKQQIVIFHADDVMSSHVNPKVNDKFK